MACNKNLQKVYHFPPLWGKYYQDDGNSPYDQKNVPRTRKDNYLETFEYCLFASIHNLYLGRKVYHIFLSECCFHKLCDHWNQILQNRKRDSLSFLEHHTIF